MKISSHTELTDHLRSNRKLFLLIYKSGSELSDCAFSRLNKIRDEGHAAICFADVNEVRDIHVAYGISSAPSLLEFREGKLRNVFKGCQTEAYYRSAVSGTGFRTGRQESGEPAKRVVVYTTPTCTWCNTLKTYFREKKISFTEINVAADQAKAQEMVRKSGQQGVPQTDINGQIVVGFDKKRINDLLEIR